MSEPPVAEKAPPPEPRVVESVELLQGNRQIVILHRGERYRLLETRNGKLILQK